MVIDSTCACCSENFIRNEHSPAVLWFVGETMAAGMLSTKIKQQEYLTEELWWYACQAITILS